ncbi:tetratricopeptide repeat protein [Planctomycetota bacterium]
MGRKSTFGAEPERIDRLLSLGLEDSNSNEAPDPTASLDFFTEKPGRVIGPYKLLSVLGEGGMGIAYLAEQKQPMRRQVAIKIIKPGMDSKRVIARFEAERQALAMMDHPNIAHVHDGGTTELGRPYFVMEYVKGLSITEYCDHHKLTIEDRLGLFLQICQAVHYAHQKGIIHRDIKPSNILVSEEQDKAIPKIIDFGVAKATGKPLTEQTVVTEDTQLLGTPEYMSPEQADMATEDIDTRSDVYSLGVLLYVLLTGVLPFEPETLREGGIEQIRKVIRETDPKTPSTRLTKLGDEATKVAESRSTQVATLARCLHRELEWIPLKAMRKERSERYQSASELARDVENYLKGAPLIAGSPGAVYRLNKAIRRHKALVAGILAVLMVSVIGTIVSVVFAVGQARARAETQAVADFLTQDVLGSAQKVKGRDAMVIDVLGAAAAKLDEGNFKDQPSVEAYVRWTLADIYKSLGYAKLAVPQRSRACQISKEQNVPVGTYNLNYTMNTLALSYLNAGEYQKAESLFKELIQLNEPDKTGLYHWYKLNLIAVYDEQGRYKEARDLGLELMQTAWWKMKPRKWLARGVNLLGEAYHGQGLYDQAEQTFMNVLDYDPNALQISRAQLYVDMGHYNEAEALLTKAIQITRDELSGKGHPVTLWAVSILAVLRTLQGHHDEAAALFTEALAGQEIKVGNDHPVTLRTVNGFGVLRREQKQYEQAESLLRQALDGRLHRLGDDHPACYESIHELAVLYKEQARYEEAEKLLLEALEGRRLKLGDTHPQTLQSLNSLIDLYETWNKRKKSKIVTSKTTTNRS